MPRAFACSGMPSDQNACMITPYKRTRIDSNGRYSKLLRRTCSPYSGERYLTAQLGSALVLLYLDGRPQSRPPAPRTNIHSGTVKPNTRISPGTLSFIPRTGQFSNPVELSQSNSSSFQALATAEDVCSTKGGRYHTLSFWNLIKISAFSEQVSLLICGYNVRSYLFANHSCDSRSVLPRPAIRNPHHGLQNSSLDEWKEGSSARGYRWRFYCGSDAGPCSLSQ